MSENSELFKKLDPDAQFQWERISSAVQPRRSLRGSEAEPTTNSRYNSFRGCHWTQEGYEGSFGNHGQTVFRSAAYVDLQPLGLTGGDEKSDSPFVSTLRPPSSIGPGMQVFQQASGSLDQAYQDPRRTYFGCRPFCPEQSGQGLLKRLSTCLRQRKYSQSVKNQGEDVLGARLRPAL